MTGPEYGPKRVLLNPDSWLPADTVDVTRPGRWGNPFRVGSPFAGCRAADNHRQAVELYRAAVNDSAEYRALARLELAGKDLACTCPTDQECHADVLIAIANAPRASAADISLDGAA